MNTRAVVVALGLANLALFGTTLNETAAPIATQEPIRSLSPATSAAPTPPSLATLPTITPPLKTTFPSEALPRVGYSTTSPPSLDPERAIASLPTVAPSPVPEPDRAGCDPAYPDERTCIPPGPPFEQGCAITAERRFTVLPPDPQGLDHDGDGIGCEPIGSP